MTTPLLGDEELAGEVVGVVFRDPTTGFGVVEVVTATTGHGVRCAGPLSTLVEGQHIRLTGSTINDPRYGETFRAVYFEHVTPATVPGITRYLSSEHFAFLDKSQLTQIVAAFGGDTARVIEDTPERLISDAGLDQAVADRICQAWRHSKVFAALLAYVEPYNWPTAMTVAIHVEHGVDALDVVQHAPYQCIVLPHVRFAALDRAGPAANIAPNHPDRLMAGARAAVQQACAQGGHQHLGMDEAVIAAAQLLSVDRVLARDGLDAALTAGLLDEDMIDGARIVALPEALRAERGLAQHVQRLLDAEHTAIQALGSDDIDDAGLTDDQAAAVQQCVAAPVSVITGGPGTGKTTVITHIARMADDASLHVALCAPTGRAAKRLEEITGVTATTIHRLLEARPSEDGFTFRYGSGEQLPVDLIVVDEVSMCDTWLMWQLMQAVRTGTQVIFVGDPDQLPSVGSGAVLRDLIAAPSVPTATLRHVHRQAAESAIISLAHHVRSGSVPELPSVDGDTYFAEEADTEALVQRVVRAVTAGVPEHLDVDSADVQVLAPVYGGAVGVDALNAALKAACNPGGSRPSVAGFHIGDRVMQTRNDLALAVANGDVGVIVDLDRKGATLTVRYPLGDVAYDRSDARNLTLAWAVTVHKAQGGEWPVVIMVCDRTHRHMHWRNLMYTAVTRAQRALIIMGQRATFAAAVARQRDDTRITGLQHRLT